MKAINGSASDFEGEKSAIGNNQMPNQINVIAPYWLDDVQTWVFDDERVGLMQEPFVAGADVFLSHLVQDIPNARNGFRLLFSTGPFPGYQHKLTWLAVNPPAVRI